MTESTRRAMMLGAGGTGLAALLSACASYGSPTSEVSVESPAPEEEASSDAPKKKKTAKKALADTADIPSGGGKVFEGQKIVVTQPTDGEFKAFTAICTHQGCTVASVSNGTINCPCHGSKFNIADGSVAAGPASDPLEEKQITVDGDKIRLA
ncbi:Rieske (2Fe-2S) protein [Nonomuraea jiangxiensis]|uniref:Cytochrome bc1 complex Rieske iron-sulfur subunit n=1 Tax=Nonomuraea jiangxiensis TaxID=633440 RepID=A0A1G9GVG8_9ACTN|nr:Rieske (2Fe-2S) protein [Nonomuraea jiangxiensis]SDL04594.1 Ferredoxin subunit of nitrite reductase or a ring-hydroxylating dioxygenase [Nonomuraea jiangxiensis]